ncbi:uncharacterized protein [Apostichopus japonicus]|uniref:uncharacterized protein n=1 Tax=Stichopus japonicus TaxID=307972 RepID=UPI003AB136E9
MSLWINGIYLFVVFFSSLCFDEGVLALYGNQCAKSPTLDKDAPNNIYFCPFENPDGTENVYTECCYNDRPDEEGNYYSCCRSDDDKESERTANAQRVAFIIGGVAAILFSAVFLFTYCRSDTFPVVERIKGRITFWWQSISDHVCFCLCCKKNFQRDEKKEDVVAIEDNTVFQMW